MKQINTKSWLDNLFEFSHIRHEQAKISVLELDTPQKPRQNKVLYRPPMLLAKQSMPTMPIQPKTAGKYKVCCLFQPFPLSLLFDMKNYHASLACYHPFGLDFRDFNLFRNLS
jgi:hypothetical protein